MSLKPTEIHMQKTIAMGTSNMSDAGDYDCDRAFGMGRNIHGKEEVSRKRAMKDGSRSMGHLEKHADHGEHGMAMPKDGMRTGSEPRNI